MPRRTRGADDSCRAGRAGGFGRGRVATGVGAAAGRGGAAATEAERLRGDRAGLDGFGFEGRTRTCSVVSTTTGGTTRAFALRDSPWVASEGSTRAATVAAHTAVPTANQRKTTLTLNSSPPLADTTPKVRIGNPGRGPK